jgi:hypothetical protein
MSIWWMILLGGGYLDCDWIEIWVEVMMMMMMFGWIERRRRISSSSLLVG